MNTVSVAGVLAGGASARMGRPKALLRLPDGETMLERAARVAASVSDEVVILGTPPSMPTALAHIRVLPDALRDRGPLAGLCSLLQYAPGDWTLLLGCDMPALRVPLVQRLIDAVADDVNAVCYRQPREPARYESCCALYHPRIASLAVELLTAGPHGLQALLRRVRTRALPISEEEANGLVDVDTAADFERLGGQEDGQ